MKYPVDGSLLEDKIASTVHMVIETAVELGTSLATLERNTRGVFWWTSWAITIVLGLFVLNLLVRVRTQLVELNEYQSTFQRMWLEDREHDEELERERRKRDIKEGKRISPASVRPKAQLENYVNRILDEEEDSLDEDDLPDIPIRSPPQPGTREYDEYLAAVRGQLRSLRTQLAETPE
ncbi:hypothetical protein GQX73_g964 [Xylaria multiplex]|uniref:Uncharacterized protein n=1 Tax=Xylaria multiplex TaxID=323545 RepID=A0A7C8IXF8_9PEZI|nr:hypothetical protein GQX73_g964 [Xylaria multiplex]